MQSWKGPTQTTESKPWLHTGPPQNPNPKCESIVQQLLEFWQCGALRSWFNFDLGPQSNWHGPHYTSVSVTFPLLVVLFQKKNKQKTTTNLNYMDCIFSKISCDTWAVHSRAGNRNSHKDLRLHRTRGRKPPDMKVIADQVISFLLLTS